jgi:hypothetical protein
MKCLTCEFYEDQDVYIHDGICRKNPPLLNGFAKIYKHDWCDSYAHSLKLEAEFHETYKDPVRKGIEKFLPESYLQSLLIKDLAFRKSLVAMENEAGI